MNFKKFMLVFALFYHRFYAWKITSTTFVALSWLNLVVDFLYTRNGRNRLKRVIKLYYVDNRLSFNINYDSYLLIMFVILFSYRKRMDERNSRCFVVVKPYRDKPITLYRNAILLKSDYRFGRLNN